jgi:hypothetical protein
VVLNTRAINPSSLIRMLGFRTSHLCQDKSGRQVSLYFVFLNFRVIFELNRRLYIIGPNSRDRSIIIIEQGVIAIAAFDALNKKIDSVAKL